MRNTNLGLAETRRGGMELPHDMLRVGEEVFWLTSAPGRVMRLAAGASEAVVLAQVGRPTHLAVDKTHVYWTDRLDGTVRRVARDGGAVEVLATGQDGPDLIVVDEWHVYWLTASGAVQMVNKQGGDPGYAGRADVGAARLARLRGRS